MPDISMCQDNQCPVRKNCRRHQALGTQPSEMQWYSDFHHESSDDGCEDFWLRESDL